MGKFLSDREVAKLKYADEAAFRGPIPTQCVSNGEFNPQPQGEDQKKVEARTKELADELGARHGMKRREFLQSTCGMAAAFLAMNEVYGNVFDVDPAEAAEPEVTLARAESLAGQFIFDVQTHFVRDDFEQEGLLGLGNFAADHWNPALDKETLTLATYKFENYLKEIFTESDTDICIISNAPFDNPEWEFLTSENMVKARDLVNTVAGGQRMLAHNVVSPGKPGWMDKVDESIEVHKPDSWKMYTIGDPFGGSQYVWRLDDEKLLYPFYEKAVKAGITNICIHKGLLPADYEESFAGHWQYATVWDLGKAAKDWPEINFIIYHSAAQQFLEVPDNQLAPFESTGELNWTSDLARIPEEYGVNNVYGELGTVFANSCVTHPRLAAGLVGTLIKGLGADHVVWGTDSPFYGSPQWQIEALRRLKMPEEYKKKYGFAGLGSPNGAIKNGIFGFNSAAVYNLDVRASMGRLSGDKFAAIKKEVDMAGGFRTNRSNAAYGYVNTA